MKAIENACITTAFFTLMILRIFFAAPLFNSVGVVGFLVTWIDMFIKVSRKYPKTSSQRPQIHGAILLFMVIIAVLSIVFGVTNLVLPLKWLNPVVLDEFTLAALLLSLCQDAIIELVGNIIGVEP